MYFFELYCIYPVGYVEYVTDQHTCELKAAGVNDFRYTVYSVYSGGYTASMVSQGLCKRPWLHCQKREHHTGYCTSYFNGLIRGGQPTASWATCGLRQRFMWL